MKATLVIYDDMFELDRTDVSYTNMAHLRAIADSLGADWPEAELIEVYVLPEGKLSYKYTRAKHAKKLKEQRVSDHPNWGGYRPGSGGKFKKPEERLCVRYTVQVRTDMAKELEKVKGETIPTYIRRAISEKIERDKDIKFDPLPTKLPKKEPQYSRFHRIISTLPPYVKKYEERTRTKEYLHIRHTDDEWQIYYGEKPNFRYGNPAFHSRQLDTSVENMNRWLLLNNIKWVVGGAKKPFKRVKDAPEDEPQKQEPNE